MFDVLRKQVNASTALAVVALLFAMTGGAFAVTGGGGSPRAVAAKKKAKVVRGPRGPEGKQGKEGKQGPAGPEGKEGKEGKQGLQGLEGKEGKEGKQGIPGKEGKEGASGKGVTLGAASGCGEGIQGITVEVEGSGSPQEVCDGQPGPIAHVLPVGATETGSFYFHFGESETAQLITVVDGMSLPIQLEEKIPFGEKIETVQDGSPTEHCKGSFEHPQAASKFACFYSANSLVKIVVPFPGQGVPGVGPAGAPRIGVEVEPSGEGEAYVSWAVTG